MTVPIRIRERIVCAAIEWVTPLRSVTLSPINKPLMNIYNEILDDQPGAIEIPVTFGFITNHGRFVDDKEAREIAIASNQCDTFRFPHKLCETDLWELQ
jgi:hypothetical protein